MQQQTNPKTKYEVLGIIREGGYGTVTNQVTGELVALKLLKNDGIFSQNLHRELEMLGYIKELDPNLFNLVKLIDTVDYTGCQCLVFEMLDMSVHDLMQKTKIFMLCQIQPMAEQLLMALHSL
ncbi:hypothetical protein NQD34_003632 [Periophthalmus magnuspinnatus]|nr:hypothetical protein NQD34_003632 [Periophthalmus magnuspinnatus]